MRKSVVVACIFALGLSLFAGPVTARSMKCCAGEFAANPVLQCCQPSDHQRASIPAIRTQASTLDDVQMVEGPGHWLATLSAPRAIGYRSVPIRIKSPPAFLLKSTFLI